MRGIFILSLLIVLLIVLGGIGLTRKIVQDTKKEAQKETQEALPQSQTKEESKSMEGQRTTIITIYDNYKWDPQLKTGWGFSCLVEMPEQKILFDTGADSETLLSNMEKMGMEPKEINIIVLSHIHADHTGGLEGMLKVNSNLEVFLPSSFPDSFKKTVVSYGARVNEVSKSVKISNEVYTTGELGTEIKEQSLIIKTKKGLVVITGCAHPGIVDILGKAKELTNENIYLVLGGFHLLGRDDSQLREVIKKFRGLGVRKVAPCHCSGDRTRELFKEEYKDDFFENGVGKIIEI